MGNMQLPDKIQKLLADEGYKTDDMGMSGSSVLLYENKVLKVQENSEEAGNEVRMLRYLKGKLPVPDVIFHEIMEEKSYLLMEKCKGQMACAPEYMADPTVQCRLLADGLKRLWSIDYEECPSDQRLSHKLKQAQYNIKNGLVDLENVEPDTFGEKGFKDPADLLRWLYDNRPKEELVLSHGDYCLPNIFGIRGNVSGYIDLGKTGIADKWCDIALCYRSLSHNYSGKYHDFGKNRENASSGFDDRIVPPLAAGLTGRQPLPLQDYGLGLFRELGMEPNWEKIRYYILLDELF